MGWSRSTSDNAGRVIEAQTFSGASLPAPWGGNSSSTGSCFPSHLRAIRDDNGLGPIKKAFLVDVIGKSRTKEAASALIEMLSYSDAFIRGLAVSHLGRRRYKLAIPYLVKLLDDKGVFVTDMQTDPDRNEPVLVRENAVEALQAITGRTMDAGTTQDERARAWRDWWEKQQRPK